MQNDFTNRLQKNVVSYFKFSIGFLIANLLYRRAAAAAGE